MYSIRVGTVVFCLMIILSVFAGLADAKLDPDSTKEAVQPNAVSEAEWLDLINRMRTNCESWLPERYNQLKYVCEYDVKVFNGKGEVDIDSHWRHPYTRAVTLNLLPEWLIYGNTGVPGPSKMYREDGKAVFEYVSLTGMIENRPLPTAISHTHQRIMDPWSYSFSFKEPLDDWLVRDWTFRFKMYVDEKNARPDKVEWWVDFGASGDQGKKDMHDTFDRQEFVYDERGRIEKVRHFSSLKREYKDNAKGEWPKNEDFRGWNDFKFEYADGIAYISEVDGVSSDDPASASPRVLISNFKVEPLNASFEKNSPSDLLYKHAYLRTGAGAIN